MERHLNLLGILYIVLGAFHILSLGIAAVFLFGFGHLSGIMDLVIVKVIVAVVFGFLGLVALLGIAGGIGLLKGQSWARGLVLVLGFLMLINVPLGTLLGIYTIWVFLLQDREQPRAIANQG